MNLNSGLTSWLAENLKKDDLILTPEYSINEVTMSGGYDVSGMALLCMVRRL